ncbi:hypothetical protein B0T24DRAFT_590037 [Lasiosphaeria ovina]|uniref:Ig-like domain-containing protein n=1 Tax=Lasiosphaeria ovina TaxID=92902 RepID=A0AAE0KP08_9PEZI|nr:hypothetical protein B0T24DRAFT_590037 [Lasiosphaeria ovina]
MTELCILLQLSWLRCLHFLPSKSKDMMISTPRTPATLKASSGLATDSPIYHVDGKPAMCAASAVDSTSVLLSWTSCSLTQDEDQDQPVPYSAISTTPTSTRRSWNWGGRQSDDTAKQCSCYAQDSE